METRPRHHTFELRSVVQVVLEAACFSILAVAATLAIVGMRSRFEPTANPAGMTEIGYILVVLSILVAVGRFIGRAAKSLSSPR